MLRTSSCIPSNRNKYYFECQVQHHEIADWNRLGIGFTSNNDRINEDDPAKDPNTLGINFGYQGKLSTIQCGVGKEVENFPTVEDGDVIGFLLSNVQLDAVKLNVLQCFLNGSQIGFPLAGESGDMYPSIWMSQAGSIVQCNLGQTKYEFMDLLGNSCQ